MKKNIAEVIGTFTLVFMSFSTITFMADQVGALGISLSFGLAVVAMAYGIGPISGAHLNPAVSIGAFMAGRMSMPEMIGYWVAQVVGGLAAAFVILAMSGDPAMAKNMIGPQGLAAALIFEVVATFLFVTVILGATQDGHATPVAGLAIGLTLTLIHIAGIAITGVSVNPARSIASNLFDGAALAQLWLFLVAPLAGGALAGILHKNGLTRA
ncbi:aquaporin [Ruegeria pomeroyi]|uniref:Aquaporin n=1 Tax=Ruegeria alba TaxID=2916756 RepID=A0ABS9NTX9_9RHOB|nr:aquaporin [Ruegeria alba]MCE8511712.1 aquaporin [Ruegeria pomeroyi]MCE8520142.1 aquaporin [Ruegeria pomeroyi]MCE8523730.1 aquaporin [Ruegeria pomeroyi]MCE8527617.1 aquaporin [Ruegeria pomeroyi]MCE8532538.1 aquaporin [Ruegeria pomeroyi]